MIAPERVEQFLQKLPVDALWGVGPVTAARLRERGIERLVDVRTADARGAARRRRQQAEWLRAARRRASTTAPVEPNREPKSSGTREHLRAGPDRHRRDPRGDRRDGARRGRVARAARALLCRTVTIKVRYSDFTTITRSHSQTPPTRDGEEIAQRAVALLEQHRGRDPRRCACSASACTTSRIRSAPFEPEEPLLPFEP